MTVNLPSLPELLDQLTEFRRALQSTVTFGCCRHGPTRPSQWKI